jgi:hypothetical protein
MIKRHYGIRKGRTVEDDWRFTKIEKIRHDLVHFGKVPPDDAALDRYMQLLFLDLLREILNLPCVGHLRTYVMSGVAIDALGIVGQSPDPKHVRTPEPAMRPLTPDEERSRRQAVERAWEEWSRMHSV